MKERLTLGQFYSTASPIHDLDPRVKIRFVICFIILLLCDRNLPLFAMLSLLCGLALCLCRVPVRHLLSGSRGIWILILLGSLLGLFSTYGTPLLRLGGLTLTDTGLTKCGFLLWRMSLLYFISAIFMSTTTPTALNDGFEKCFHLKGETAMGITIALRFLPVLSGELERIRLAREARGAKPSGGPVKRARLLFSVMVPLFQTTVDRAGNLADAMEARCYTGGKGRTRLYPLKYGVWDAVAYLVLLGMVAAGIFFIIRF